jgi:hypothetical protein
MGRNNNWITKATPLLLPLLGIISMLILSMLSRRPWFSNVAVSKARLTSAESENKKSYIINKGTNFDLEQILEANL